MRHTFISIVKNDMPEALLRTQMGHSKDMDTLGVYGHKVDGELAQAAKYIDAAFNRLLPHGKKVGGRQKENP